VGTDDLSLVVPRSYCYQRSVTRGTIPNVRITSSSIATDWKAFWRKLIVAAGDAAFKELENRIRLFILVYERARVKKAAA
jgi:hypothetical protein